MSKKITVYLSSKDIERLEYLSKVYDTDGSNLIKELIIDRYFEERKKE